MKNELTKDDIELYLKEINESLKEENTYGEILLVGGAVLTLKYNARESTKDVDAVFNPRNNMLKIIENIAANRDLDKRWLNDAAKEFITPAMKTETIRKYSNLTVNSVDAESLLAMKLAAARDETKDKDDVIILMKYLKLIKEEQLSNIVEKYHPRAMQDPKTYFFIEKCFDEYEKQKSAELKLSQSAESLSVPVKVISDVLEEKINENTNKINMDKKAGHNTKNLVVNVREMKNFKAMVDKVNDRNYPVKINGIATAENIMAQKITIGKQISNIRVKEKGNTQGFERER